MKSILITIAGFATIVGLLWWAGSAGANDPDVLSTNGIHWHPELEIYIEGEKFEIPANIGLVGGHSPMHTHTGEPGIIHMEFDGRVTLKDTELGNFFDIWKKDFSSTQIFENINGEEGSVFMTVNGEENLEFETYQMKEGDKIVVRFE
ncbi:hypothetical protein COB87_001495 [Candidatus Wolfebacteria bacterium]|nr:hypothetical protein [Candidatus Wolfebacteria bacterium]